jgi:hypothetical protein
MGVLLGQCGGLSARRLKSKGRGRYIRPSPIQILPVVFLLPQTEAIVGSDSARVVSQRPSSGQMRRGMCAYPFIGCRRATRDKPRAEGVRAKLTPGL